jgi:hypothetical protein
MSVLFLASASAAQKDLSKGTCTFSFNPPLEYSRDQKYKIGVSSFSFTNFFVNISAALANNIFYYTDDLAVPDKYTISIPDGSYNTSDLSEMIDIGVVANGHTSGLITLLPDFSTNKIIFQISLAGYQLYFPALSPYLLLGMTLNQKVPALALTTGVYTEFATNVATFNNLLTIYLKSSLTYESNFSGGSSNIIASVIPTSSIGSIQNSEPYNIIWIPANGLSGQSVSSVKLELCDQNQVPLNLNDDFSCTILINPT